MGTPVASATVIVSTTITPILTVTLDDEAYLILRNNGPNAATVEIAFSSDGGVNFQIMPEATLADPTIFVSGAQPPPYPFPSPLQRGDQIRVRGTAAAGTTSITAEIYRPRTDLGRTTQSRIRRTGP